MPVHLSDAANPDTVRGPGKWTSKKKMLQVAVLSLALPERQGAARAYCHPGVRLRLPTWKLKGGRGEQTHSFSALRSRNSDHGVAPRGFQNAAFDTCRGSGCSSVFRAEIRTLFPAVACLASIAACPICSRGRLASCYARLTPAKSGPHESTLLSDPVLSVPGLDNGGVRWPLAL
jgi:hypothetical protein